MERLSEFDITTGKEANILEHAAIFPASHYVVGEEGLESILARIKKDMEKEVEAFKKKNKLLEAQRLLERVSYDIEMIREIGYCNGMRELLQVF